MQVVKQTSLLDEYIQAMRREINPSIEYEKITRRVLGKLDLMTATESDIGDFLDRLRKPQSEDPMHKWIGTYNMYVTIFKRFFKWVNNPECVKNIVKLRRKEKSVYKPSDLWTQDDDLLFLKYCPSKREKCYHMIARDSSCRPSEILRLRIKDVVFKMVGGRQYAEVLVNGKTGSRHIPLINSIPYLKDWLDSHPMNTPDSPLICNIGKWNGKHMTSINLWRKYNNFKTEFFPKLLNDRNVPVADKKAITVLLSKPWNPYVRRHSALTDKSKILKEHILRQHAGWSPRSNMCEKYLHYFGNESSESILEAYGIKSKEEEIDKMKPKSCPNCQELNQVDARFCQKCRMILSYEEYQKTVQEEDRLDKLYEMVKEIEKKL
jgi:integrase/recombinase XerD